MWLITLLLCLFGFLCTLIFTTALRLGKGATFDELLRSRCYEIVPLRGLLWMVLGLVWGLFLFDVLLFGLRGLGLIFGDNKSAGMLATVVVTGGLAWPLHKLRLLVQQHLIDLPRIEPPSVAIGNARFQSGIQADDFTDLGSERFPNHVDTQRQSDMLIRWCILSVVFVIFVVLYHVYSQQQSAGSSSTAPVLKSVSNSPLMMNLGLFLVVVSAVPLGILLHDNRDYTLVPFRVALVLQVILGSLVILGVLWMQATQQTLLIAVGAVSLVCAIRIIADMRLAWRYSRMKKVYDPIADTLRGLAPYLPRLPQEPGFRLPALSVDTLHRRITHGCQNVEERGLFVTRHFARFLDLVEVEYQDCAMVQLRYLTWRRYMTLGPGAGTWDGLRYPEVPWWDLDRFPLYPHDGYREWLDPLGLDSEWDVVVICPTCGGAGYVTRTVTETQNNQTVTRQVQETCGGCHGSGRLRHQQILNTQWQRLLPLVTHPDMRVPELVEDAEDVTWLHLPMVEERQPLPLRPKVAVPNGPMVQQMLQTAHEVANLHPQHTAMVEKLHDGYLYRADFQACGYRTIRIRFERLRGRVGWFFGKRPEFYFPRLPLSWSAVGTCVFLPPLALVLGVALVKAAVELMHVL